MDSLRQRCLPAGSTSTYLQVRLPLLGLENCLFLTLPRTSTTTEGAFWPLWNVIGRVMPPTSCSELVHGVEDIG